MTSQITKDFQVKSKLRKLADGGAVNPSVLGKGAAARAGGWLSGRGRQIDEAVDAREKAAGLADGGGLVDRVRNFINPPDDRTDTDIAAGVPKPGSPEENKELARRVTQQPGMFPTYNRSRLRADMNAEHQQRKKGAGLATGLADGGSYLDDGYNANRYQQSQLKDGGRVKGPGGRTDDKVGPVMLSDEEYVLPGDTADVIGRDKLDAIRLATHEFKDDRKESALRGRADDVPVDHLADGGNPWIVDSDGVTRKANAFGDAAAGPAYQQPKLPPPQPGTAVGPSAMSPGTAGPRTINMGMVDEVTRPQSALRGPAAPSATAAAAAAAPAVTSVAAPAAAAAPTGRAYNVGKAVGGAAGTAGRMAGSAAITAPIAGFGDYKADTGGIDTSAGGTLGYLAKGEFGNAGTSLSGGAGEAIADSGRGIAKTADWVAGLVGAKPDLTGKFDNMIKDKLGGYLTLRNPENKPDGAMGPPKPAEDSSKAVTSSLRSDQGPAQPVTPGSYQSRRLSEMGVPLDVQNSKPVVDSVTGNTRDFLRTGGTDQYQNLGTYGGNGNIYGKADDPSRPGRINNFVGVGAGASPLNAHNGSGSDGGITSALRGLGSGPSSPGGSGGNSGPVDNSAAINARYDKLAKELSGMYGPKGQGNLARRMLELEQSRTGALDDDARNMSSLRGQDMTAETSRANAELNARVQMADTLGRMEQNRETISSQTQAAQLKALQDARARSEKLMEDNAKVFESVADTFAAGDKDKQSQYRELLSTLPPELHATAQGLAPEDKRAFYTNIVRQQLGRSEGLVLGRDAGATAQNAAIGGLIGRMTRFGNGAGGKAVDSALGKIPRVGPALSALRPAENLARFGTLIGAAGGAYATPEVENLTRWDPVARDPKTGAALPARKDIREAATYGVLDTYFNPFDDSVQTVSGRRTNKPTPDEEEAARRFRSALRN